MRLTTPGRTRRTLLLCAITGAVTGFSVLGFERLTRDGILERVESAPLAIQMVALVTGLALSAVCLHYVGRRTTAATADEYILAFHRPDAALDLEPAAGKITASIATLGSGAALGFEGPALYIGAAVGALVRRTRIVLSDEGHRALLVAGAAAGVAAIFKAPATGALFAVEVPYMDGRTSRDLVPAMIGAATGYLTFAAIDGTDAVLPVHGTPSLDYPTLLGALLLGLLCGAAARLFSLAVKRAKSISTTLPALGRVLLGGSMVVSALALSTWILNSDIGVGSGYSALAWAISEPRAIGLVVALFLIRVLATMGSVAGGGVGGLFVPLVLAGTLLGDAFSAAVHDPTTLFPIIGAAAFLAAGYRTPIAAVVFVAETTGNPGFIVPGMLAVVTSQLLIGRESVSPYQADERVLD